MMMHGLADDELSSRWFSTTSRLLTLANSSCNLVHTASSCAQLVLEYEASSAASNINALSSLINTTVTNGSVTQAVQGQGVNVSVGLAGPIPAPYNVSQAPGPLAPSVPGSINAPPSSSGGGVSSGAIVGIVAGALVVIVGAWIFHMCDVAMGIQMHALPSSHAVQCMLS